jgi:hypothetical protein
MLSVSFFEFLRFYRPIVEFAVKSYKSHAVSPSTACPQRAMTRVQNAGSGSEGEYSFDEAHDISRNETVFRQ